MRTPVPYKIGFADGEVYSYLREGSSFAVMVKAWNDDRVRVEFSDPVGVSDLGVGDISGLYVESLGSAFMKQVLSTLYDTIPSSHPYLLYQFLNLDDEPALEVVASGVEISPLEPD